MVRSAHFQYCKRIKPLIVPKRIGTEASFLIWVSALRIGRTSAVRYISAHLLCGRRPGTRLLAGDRIEKARCDVLDAHARPPLGKGLEPTISGSDLFVSPEVSCVQQLLVVRRAHSQLVPIPPSKERSDKFVDSADGAALFDALAWIGRRRG
jgi:hypothetical protein